MYNFAGLHVFSGSISDVVSLVGKRITQKKHAYVCVTGAHGVYEAQRSVEVMVAHTSADLVVPDGMPLVWIGKALGHKNTQRIYGPDLMLALCEVAEANRWKILFYGTTKITLAQLAEQLYNRFPNLAIVGLLAPPFHGLSPEEDAAFIQKINFAKPHIIFVGMSTPIQELWMNSHIDKLSANVLIGVGAAFDFVAGTKKQAPRWIQRVGLEWAYRVTHEPKRLIGRYIRIGWSLLLLIVKRGCSRFFGKRFRKYVIRFIALLILTIMLFCAIELTARIATDRGWVSYFRPIRIQSLMQQSGKIEDWRLTHMMKDDQFVLDPRLFWKPKKNTWRFNADGYIGTVGLSEIDSVHKIDGCVVLALGDSNTQGIETNSWPEELDKLFLAQHLQGRVMNAGVAGYTSMQGQQKFKEEIDRIHPTVIFISFGWNDVTPSMGVPDSEFLEYYSPIPEALSKLRLFLIFKNWKTVDFLNTPYRPRVSIEQYLNNIQNIILESEKRGIKVVLLTRSYNSSHVDGWRPLEPNKGGWRMRVPLYNEVIRRLAALHKLPLLDLQKITEFTPEVFIDDSHFSSAENLDVALETLDLIQSEKLCGSKIDIR